MLAEQPEFTPASLFYRLDAARKKFITEKDIEDFLVDSNIPYRGSDLKTLFGRIDVNQTQTISLREYISPKLDSKTSSYLTRTHGWGMKQSEGQSSSLDLIKNLTKKWNGSHLNFSNKLSRNTRSSHHWITHSLTLSISMQIKYSICWVAD